VQVIFEGEGQTVRFSVNGHFLAFDGEGTALPDVRGAMNAVSAHHELELVKRDEVPQLDVVREAQRELNELNATRHWQLIEADLDRIRADLTGRARIARAKGVEVRQ
jgi:hypothetical protein